jgi:hypothetical protein
MSSLLPRDVFQRPSYRKSGKVDWPRFRRWVWLPVAASLLTSYLFVLLISPNHVLLLFGPMLLGLPIGGLVTLAVRRGHCRNQVVACFTCAVCFLVYLAGYLLFDYVNACGWAGLLNPLGWLDFFPLRLREVYRSSLMPSASDVEEMAWTLFSLVGGPGCAIVLASLIACSAVGMYCENCRHWIRSRTVYPREGTGEFLVRLLQEGKVHELPLVEREELGFIAILGARATVFYCSPSPDLQRRCPVYLTLVDQAFQRTWLVFHKAKLWRHPFVPKPATRRQRFRAQASIMLWEVPLTTNETLQLGHRIPSFQMTWGPAITGIPHSEDRHFANGFTVQTIPGTAPRYEYFVLQILICYSLSFMPLIVFLAGLVLGGIGMAGFGAWYFLPLGILLVVVAGPICWLNVEWLNFSHVVHRLRRVIGSRPDALVNPADPEAAIVTVVPREQWAKFPPDNPIDGGFLKIDEASRQLLFEGTRQRYRIPAAAILSCRVEPLALDTGFATQYAVVVRVETGPETGFPAVVWEAPFLPMWPGLTGNGRKRRRQRAEALCERVRKLTEESGDGASMSE